MALDTIAVQIPHSAVNEYLNKLDKREETYAFIVTSAAVAFGKSEPIVLTLHRDGCDDALELLLMPDGTWKAKHCIVVGETL